VNFTMTLTAGAFILAAWLDNRLDERRPATIARRVAHVAISCVLLQLAAVGMTLVAPNDADKARQFVSVFVVLLPALVYAFVAGLWLLRTLAETAVARR
jgi:hypothetical protein